MSNFTKQLDEKKDTKEREKTRREKLAGYFFDLSKLIFTGLVIGGVTPLFADEPSKINWLTVLMGCFSTYMFALFANKLLK